MFTSVTYICQEQLYKMVNTADFTKRLEKILEEYELSAAAFAQKIDVGRATISHILSGRNKPSLDFALKVIAAFPEVDLYWLLLGQGSFPKSQDHHSPIPTLVPLSEPSARTAQQATETSRIPSSHQSAGKAIKKIVVFYTDNTFESYEN